MRKKKLRNIRSVAVRSVLFVFIAIVAFLLVVPTFLTVTNSFMSQTEISANYGKIFSSLGAGEEGGRVYVSEKTNLKFIPDMVSFSQYSTFLLKSPDYLLKFWNSVILVVPIMVFQIILACGAAYSFSRFKTKFRGAVLFIYIILMLMPYQVTLVPNYIVSDMFGMLDTVWAIIIPGMFAPFSVFILTKFMRKIPSSIIEAAKLDGANEWRIFTRICVPMSRSIIYSVAILVFIDYWNMVEQPLVLLKDSAMHPLSVFLSKINSGDTGLAFAAATVYMIPTMLVFLYSEDYLVDGISYSGSIKG